jgi:hypothetical protein
MLFGRVEVGMGVEPDYARALGVQPGADADGRIAIAGENERELTLGDCRGHRSSNPSLELEAAADLALTLIDAGDGLDLGADAARRKVLLQPVVEKPLRPRANPLAASTGVIRNGDDSDGLDDSLPNRMVRDAVRCEPVSSLFAAKSAEYRIAARRSLR